MLWASLMLAPWLKLQVDKMNCRSCYAANNELENGLCHYCRADRRIVIAVMSVVIPIVVAFGVAMLVQYSM